MKLKALIGGAVAAAVLATTGVAAAAPEPTGWDDVNDVIVGGGSDTTYNFMQRAERLYNQALGCDTVNSTGSPDIGKCLTVGQTATVTNGNWDHDSAVSLYPTGSSAGVRGLQNGQFDYARSSRGPNTSGDTGTNFWAYGKDGIAMITLGNRTPFNFTKAQIQGIYNCSITNWNQLPGYTGAAGVIEPVGMNPSSGTKSTFQSYLGFDPNNGTCVKKLASGVFPFENDVKPLVADPGINENNAVWWMSYAEYRAFSFKRGNSQIWSVDNVLPSSGTVSSNAYPITRFIYHVTSSAVTGVGPSSNVTGPDGGKPGAVREMTEFMCRTSTEHAVNNFSGSTNYSEMGQAYTDTGFIRLPTAERTNGICRLLPAP